MIVLRVIFFVYFLGCLLKEINQLRHEVKNVYIFAIYYFQKIICVKANIWLAILKLSNIIHMAYKHISWTYFTACTLFSRDYKLPGFNGVYIVSHVSASTNHQANSVWSTEVWNRRIIRVLPFNVPVDEGVSWHE